MLPFSSSRLERKQKDEYTLELLTSLNPKNNSWKYPVSKTPPISDQIIDYSLKYAEEEIEEINRQPLNHRVASFYEINLDKLKNNTLCEKEVFSIRSQSPLINTDTVNILPSYQEVILPDTKNGDQSSISFKLHQTQTDQIKEDGNEGIASLESPLVFSRSSSKESLSSYDFPDDSVISELSQIASGVVSPSELPDSPLQTVSPVPCCTKALPLYPEIQKSVTVDSAQYHEVPSLSDLTCENDHLTRQTRRVVEPIIDHPAVEDNEEAMLADCISKGKPNIKKNCTTRVSAITSLFYNEKNLLKSMIINRLNNLSPEVSNDSTIVYHSEDMPASYTYVMSKFDALNLSDFSDNESDSNVSDDESEQENILAECILSGMPQARKTSIIKPVSERLEE